MADGKRLSARIAGWSSLALVTALVVAVGIWFALDPGLRGSLSTQSRADNALSDDFEQRIRQYLLDNPEVIIESLKQYETRRRAAELGEVATMVQDRAQEIFNDPGSPVGGNPEGDVTLVEFFDYNCPYCRQAAPRMIEAEANDPDLRIVYKEFPILGPDSMFAAIAALAAQKQGKYVTFHKALMQADGAANESKVFEIAAAVGLDTERLQKDMADPAIQGLIDRNLRLAFDLRITGTPGFVVGNEIIRGIVPLDTLEAAIARAREAE
ncbi:MAG TPA: DsbA family protein [Methyloceanibacter sp.]|nr:DsbA family protein [Methyloceanibacter sp.]